MRLAALLVELDALGDACCELGLRLAADAKAIDPATVAELHERVQHCAQRLRGLMARLPGSELSDP
jgi:hypothetical protein